MRRWLVIAGLVAAGVAVGVASWPQPPVAPQASGEAEARLPDFEAVEVTARDDSGLSLTGTVKDSAGNPVPGADVSLAASGQASLSSLPCGDCPRQLLSCPAPESALKIASL